jgi:hypothetical protein
MPTPPQALEYARSAVSGDNYEPFTAGGEPARPARSPSLSKDSASPGADAVFGDRE